MKAGTTVKLVGLIMCAGIGITGGWLLPEKTKEASVRAAVEAVASMSNQTPVDGVAVTLRIDGEERLYDCQRIDVPPPEPEPEPEPEPTYDCEFRGPMDSLGFNIWSDQGLSWCIHDADMNGDGADATLYAVGTNCRIERATIYGGKHGIRMASVNGLVVSACNISSDSSNLGKVLKICGALDRAPASRNITIENCTLVGIVAIQPQSKDPLASCEVVENVTLRNCTIKPHGNTAVEIAAKHVLIEKCTFDFRWALTSYGRGVSVRTYNGVVPEDVTVRNCMIRLDSDQTGDLIHDPEGVVSE